MPSLYEHIGQKIRELRSQGGLSQGKLAAELDVAANTVSRWETGTYKPTPEDLDKLARFFAVPISTFFLTLEPDKARVAALTSATGGLLLRLPGSLEVRRLSEVGCALRGAEHSRAKREDNK